MVSWKNEKEAREEIKNLVKQYYNDFKKIKRHFRKVIG